MSEMSLIVPRLLRLPPSTRVACLAAGHAKFSTTTWLRKDPRLSDLGRVLKDEYSVLRDEYSMPFSYVVPSSLHIQSFTNCLSSIFYFVKHQSIKQAVSFHLGRKGAKLTPSSRTQKSNNSRPRPSRFRRAPSRRPKLARNSVLARNPRSTCTKGY
jgi:hypothetical protein